MKKLFLLIVLFLLYTSQQGWSTNLHPDYGGANFSADYTNYCFYEESNSDDFPSDVMCPPPLFKSIIVNPDGSITIKWFLKGGGTGYTIYINSVPITSVNGFTNEYTTSPLCPGTYQICIARHCNEIFSGLTCQSVTVNVCPAPVITSVNVDHENGTITLYWLTDSPCVFLSYPSINGTSALPTSGTSFQFTNLEPGEYTVCVQSGCGNSLFSELVCETVTINTICRSTEEVAVTFDQTAEEITITWDAVSEAIEYAIIINNDTPIIVGSGTTSHTISTSTLEKDCYTVCVEVRCQGGEKAPLTCTSFSFDPDICNPFFTSACYDPCAGHDIRIDDPGSFTDIQEIREALNNPSPYSFGDMLGANGIKDWTHFGDPDDCSNPTNISNPMEELMNQVRIFHDMSNDYGQDFPGDPNATLDISGNAQFYDDLQCEGFDVQVTLMSIFVCDDEYGDPSIECPCDPTCSDGSCPDWCLIPDGIDNNGNGLIDEKCTRDFPDAWYYENEWTDPSNPYDPTNPAYYLGVKNTMKTYMTAFLEAMTPENCDCGGETTPENGCDDCFVDAIEIGNEPWGYPDPAVYQSIVAGALEAYDEFEGCKPRMLPGAFQAWRPNEEDCVDITDCEAAINSENFGCLFDDISMYVPCEIFDVGNDYGSAINIHPYSFPWDGNPSGLNLPPEDPQSEFNGIYNAIAWGMENAPGTPVQVTEFGYDTNYPATDVSECAQAAYLVRSLLIQGRLHIEKSYMYSSFDLGHNSPIPYQSSGIYTTAPIDYTLCDACDPGCCNNPSSPEAKPKKAFHTLNHFMDEFGDWNFEEAISEDANLHAYILSNSSGDRALIFWDPSDIGQDDNDSDTYCGVPETQGLNNCSLEPLFAEDSSNECFNCATTSNTVFNPTSVKQFENSMSIALPTGSRLSSTDAQMFTLAEGTPPAPFTAASGLACGFTTITHATRMPAFIPLITCAPNTTPDLIPYGSLLSPLGAGPGDNINVFTKVRNIGAVASTQASLGFFLSEDTNHDAGDIAITGVLPTINPLSGGEEEAFSLALTIPSAATADHRFLLIVADVNNDLAEGNENNNTDFVLLNDCSLSIDNFEVSAVGVDHEYELTIELTETATSQIDIFVVDSEGNYIGLGGFNSSNAPIGTYIPWLNKWEIPSATPAGVYTLTFSYYNIDPFPEVFAQFNDQTCSLEVPVKEMFAPSDGSDNKSSKSVGDQKENSIDLFPNPTKDLLNIDLSAFEGLAVDLKVYTSSGQLQKTMSIDTAPETPVTIDTKSLANGLYLLQVESQGGRHVKHFVVNR